MTSKKRILIVATEFAPAYSWGGPVFSLLRLAKELGSENYVVVFASTRLEPSSRQKITKTMIGETFEGITDIVRYDHVPLIGLSMSATVKLWHCIRQSDLVYINSTYSPIVLWAVMLCLGKKLNVVWAPRGAIQARLQYSRRLNNLKILFEKILGLLLTRCSSAVHLTSDMERIHLSRPFVNIKSFIYYKISNNF